MLLIVQTQVAPRAAASSSSWSGCFEGWVGENSGSRAGLGEGCSSIQASRRAWVLPVLVIAPWERDCPEDDSVGSNPRYDPCSSRSAGQPVPVPDLDSQPEPGQCRDPA